MTISPPLVDTLSASGSTDVHSPLNLRQSLVILISAVVVTVLTLGVAVLVIILVPGAREIGLVVLGVTVPVHAALLLVVIHWGLRRAGTGWRALGFTRPTLHILHLLWQIPVVFVALLTAQGLIFAVTGTPPVAEGGGVDSLTTSAGPLVALAVFIGASLLTPLWEEAIFRGVIHGGLRRRFGCFLASLLSASIFAAFHGVPILLPYMVTLGLALAFLREFHRTLWASVIMHVCLNSLVGGAVLISVLT